MSSCREDVVTVISFVPVSLFVPRARLADATARLTHTTLFHIADKAKVTRIQIAMSFAVAISAALNPTTTSSLSRGCVARGSPSHRAAFVGTLQHPNFDDKQRRQQRQRRRAGRIGTGCRDALGGIKWADSTSFSHHRISCASSSASTGPGGAGRVLPPKTRAEGGAQDIKALFGSFFNGGGRGGKKNDARRTAAKETLLEAIAGTARGVKATEEDASAIDAAARDLERLNPNPRALKCDSLNGEWELLYTTSASILGAARPWPFRPLGGDHSFIHLFIKPLHFI